MDLATRNGQLAGEASTPPTRPNVEQDGFTIVDCRGIKLMALPHNNLLYICVHEIAMELWKLFDTPRVSVQKKIADLGIRLHQTTKTQVMVLRREGIIGNFRATMITVRDAEKLYDALEYSRRKRGLVKHILKEPGKRASRAEEHGAKKLSLQSRYYQRKSEANARSPSENLSPISAASSSRIDRLVTQVRQQTPEQRAHARTLDTPPHTVPRDLTSTPNSVTWCALNGNHAATSATSALLKRNSNHEEQEGEGDGDGCYTLLFDVLLCAKDPVLAGDSACKSHFIELLPNRRALTASSVFTSAGQERQSRMDKSLQRQGQSSKLSHTRLSVTTNQIAPRSFHPSTGGRRRWSKPQDPDYRPSPYSEKTTLNFSSSSQPSRPCRNREKESHSSTPSTSSGIRVNSLRARQLSSPPLELNDLEEQSSVYSGVSGNSSRHMSSTPERFLYLDESSEEEEEEREEDRGVGSDSDSVFSIEDSSSPEMRITVPGRGALNAMERRVVKTKLRHFAQTTSPQLTALSRGKHLPVNASPSPPPSPVSPLTVSITLANLKPHHKDAQSTPAANIPPPPPARPSNNSSLALSVRRKPGRPPNKHKSRPTALSTFVMKKRAMSPSMQSDDSSPCLSIPPPSLPAKRSRLEYESDSSNGSRALATAVEEVMPKPKRGRPSLANKGESVKSQNVATNAPLSNSHHSPVGVQCSDEVIDLRDDSASDVPVQTTSKSQKASNAVEDSAPQVLHNQSPQNEGMSATDDVIYTFGPDGCGYEEEVGGDSSYVPDDDQLSVTSSSTTSAPTAGPTSLPTGNRGRGRGRGRRSLANSNAASKRGKQKNQYSNGFGYNFTSELQSLSSSSKSSISFEQYFNYYPPKLVMKDGELVPEKSLSVKGIDRSSVGSLASGHPFMSWNLGLPVKGGVQIRGRKRRPTKAVRVT